MYRSFITDPNGSLLIQCEQPQVLAQQICHDLQDEHPEGLRISAIYTQNAYRSLTDCVRSLKVDAVVHKADFDTDITTALCGLHQTHASRVRRFKEAGVSGYKDYPAHMDRLVTVLCGAYPSIWRAIQTTREYLQDTGLSLVICTPTIPSYARLCVDTSLKQ